MTSVSVKLTTVPYSTVKPAFVFAIYLSNDILTPFTDISWPMQSATTDTTEVEQQLKGPCLGVCADKCLLRTFFFFSFLKTVEPKQSDNQFMNIMMAGFCLCIILKETDIGTAQI